MSNARDYNSLLAEYDQLHQLIQMISEKRFEMVIPTLLRRLGEIGGTLDNATSPHHRTLKEILAEKRAQTLLQKSTH